MTQSRRLPLALAGAALVATIPPAAAQASQPTVDATQTASATAAPALQVGVRSKDYAQAKVTFSNIKVTRQYYDQLPSRYQVKYPGTKVIISFLRSSAANTAQYVKSIPAGAPVELVYHHEPEGTHSDYAGTPQVAGARFVSEFNAQANVIHANSKVPVAFIGGGYQYGTGRRGYGGSFIPPTADYYYMDSYQQNQALKPATQDQTVTNFRAELAKKGKKFSGFTEYARGTVSADPATRAAVLRADNTWLKSVGARVWVYWWYPSVQTGDNWQFKDATSINTWNQILAQ